MENLDPNQNPQQPINQTSPNKKWYQNKVILAILVLAVVTGIVIYITLRRQPSSTPIIINHNTTKQQPVTSTQQTQSTTTSFATLPIGNIVIYTKVAGYQDTSNRRWETDTIYRKVNDQAPEILATVGKVGEYPSGYQLTPDKKSLLINLESKLQILDLATKNLKDLLIPKAQVEAMVYSPDKTKMLIWDQKYASTDNSYWIHIYDFTANTDSIIDQGTQGGNYLYGVWRKDNKVILSLPMGEGSRAYYYDLNTRQLKPSPGPSEYGGILEYGTLSADGTLMAVTNSNIGDVCNDMSGSTPSTYNIVDPITGKSVATVGDSKKYSSIIDFSSDNQLVLYSTQDTIKNRNNCDAQHPPVSYFTYNLSNKAVRPVRDYVQLLKSWGRYEASMVVNYETSNYTNVKSISFEGQTIATFNDEPIHLIQAYKNQ